VSYRGGPGNEFARVGTLESGTTVRVFGENKGWLQVRMADGSRGFIYKKWLEPLPDTGATEP
jgi:uncharacterized protein YgiM (DUF1202 family)